MIEYEPIEPTKQPLRMHTAITLDPPDRDGFCLAQFGCHQAYRRDAARAVEAVLRERVSELAEAIAAGATVTITRAR